MPCRGKKPLYESIGRSMGPLMVNGKPADVRSGEYLDVHKKPEGEKKTFWSKNTIFVISVIVFVVIATVIITSVVLGGKKPANAQEQQQIDQSQVVSSEEQPKITTNLETVLDNAEQNIYNPPSISKPKDTTPVVSSGANRIVVATYSSQRDLVPIVEYYAKNGISLEIKSDGERFYLVTSAKFDGFSRDSVGYNYLAEIRRVGLRYKAPDGYERFSSRPFQDAYGKKMD